MIFNAQRGVLIMMNAEHSDGKWGLKSVPCLKIMVYAKCLLQITTITTMTALNYLLKRTKTKQVILEFCIMLYMYIYVRLFGMILYYSIASISGCHDIDLHCCMIASAEYCKTNTFVQENCQKSCQLCGKS